MRAASTREQTENRVYRLGIVRFCVCSPTPGGIADMEGTIAVPGGNVWFKRVGGGAGLPLLAIHGGPGLPHNYMRALERLADEREVIFWDQLGCGNSECPSNTELWTMQRSVAETDAVVKALGLNGFPGFGTLLG